MKSIKRAVVVAIALTVGGIVQLASPRSAQAIVGRPLTPFSYAGVARRTTRRAAYGGAYAAPYVAPVAPVVAPRPVVVW